MSDSLSRLVGTEASLVKWSVTTSTSRDLLDESSAVQKSKSVAHQLKRSGGLNTLERCPGLRYRRFTDYTMATAPHIIIDIFLHPKPVEPLSSQVECPLLSLVTCFIMDASQDLILQVRGHDILVSLLCNSLLGSAIQDTCFDGELVPVSEKLQNFSGLMWAFSS